MNEEYKVVLVFRLRPGMADEELSRSQEPQSFPRRLAAQPGFLGADLVKIDDNQTMSIQTWQSADAWWAGLRTAQQAAGASDEGREEILLDRQFYSGAVAVTISPVA